MFSTKVIAAAILSSTVKAATSQPSPRPVSVTHTISENVDVEREWSYSTVHLTTSTTTIKPSVVTGLYRTTVTEYEDNGYPEPIPMWREMTAFAPAIVKEVTITVAAGPTMTTTTTDFEREPIGESVIILKEIAPGEPAAVGEVTVTVPGDPTTIAVPAQHRQSIFAYDYDYAVGDTSIRYVDGPQPNPLPSLPVMHREWDFYQQFRSAIPAVCETNFTSSEIWDDLDAMQPQQQRILISDVLKWVPTPSTDSEWRSAARTELGYKPTSWRKSVGKETSDTFAKLLTQCARYMRCESQAHVRAMAKGSAASSLSDSIGLSVLGASFAALATAFVGL